jgi:DNA-binding NarL/FixJ family response regulator
MPDLYGDRTLTIREQRILELLAEGLTNKDIAGIMGKTEHVTKNYLRVIYDKLGCWNRVELALWYEAHKTTTLQ